MGDDALDVTTEVFPPHLYPRDLFVVVELGGLAFRVVANDRVRAKLAHQFVVALIAGFFPITLQQDLCF